ncbi:MAG TPA: ATP-binding protein, partial [Candidatus Sulfotelmatobacter sp.]|nr:ATP-binding protein [Candidatus Sulfotelmatobacter sp.]
DVVGFIGAFRRRNPAFSDDDVATLRVIANVAAIALRNARLYEAAAAAREGMSSFLNLVVHELRSPLTVIAGYIDMLQTDVFGKGPAGWERPLGTMAAKTKEMQSLVDDLLFAARLEHGRLPMVSVRFDLREAALRSVERALPRATMMGASVEAVTGERGTVVEADREHVDRILDNLINNALDYGGDQPSVRVVVGEGEPTVAVEDRGPGISKDLHERVFERFFRIEGAGRRSGTGLGLHISRRLAMECRGSLDLDYSEAGKGSRFILRLPSANGAPKGSSRSRSAPRPSDRSAA